MNKTEFTGHQSEQVKATPDALVVEYQAAQDSAQHHDNLMWQVTSIMWGASLILFGFILNNLDNTHLRLLITVLSILGLFLTMGVWIFALQLNAVKRQKYDRCKELEREMNLHQHMNLRYKGGIQRIFYALIMILFIFAWILVLWTVRDC